MVAEQRSRLGRRVTRTTKVRVGLAAGHAISPKALRVAARTCDSMPAVWRPADDEPVEVCGFRSTLNEFNGERMILVVLPRRPASLFLNDYDWNLGTGHGNRNAVENVLSRHFDEAFFCNGQ